MIEKCSQALKGNSQSTSKKAVYIEYDKVRVNASELLQRIEDLSYLSKQCSKFAEQPEKFRIRVAIDPVNDWGCVWGRTEDSMLLLGVHRYGFGNWDRIQKVVPLCAVVAIGFFVLRFPSGYSRIIDLVCSRRSLRIPMICCRRVQNFSVE